MENEKCQVQETIISLWDLDQDLQHEQKKLVYLLKTSFILESLLLDSDSVFKDYVPRGRRSSRGASKIKSGTFPSTQFII